MCSYRKHGQTPQEFTVYADKLSEMFDKIQGETPYCVIATGDYNAHHKSWYSNDTTDIFGRVMQETFETHTLHQTVNQPTHLTRDRQTCIHLVCTDQPNLI